MSCKIINQHTGEVILDKKSIPDYDRWYEFDSAEEALLELVVGKNCLTLTDKTLFAIKKIVHPIEIRGVILPTHHYWRKYIFHEVGRIFAYVGEMQEPKKTNLEKPNLDAINWNLYSVEERDKYFKGIYESLGFDPHEYDVEETPVVINENFLELESIEEKIGKSSEDRKICYIDIYVLYCNDTPNIYYIGRTKGVGSRFQCHISNHVKLNTKPKYEWIKYIKDNGYELEFKVLETVPESQASSVEFKYIQQYYNVKENVLMNFTAPIEYSSDNVIFFHKFRKCLYEKQIVVVNNYEDISQIADVYPINIPSINVTNSNADPYSLVYALYCDETPHIYFVGNTKINMEKRLKKDLMGEEAGSNNRHKTEWIEYIKKNNFELKYKILEEPPLKDLQTRGYYWKNIYVADKDKVVLNFCTSYYKVNNEIMIARFKACLYEKRLIIVNNYYDMSQLENMNILESCEVVN